MAFAFPFPDQDRTGLDPSGQDGASVALGKLLDKLVEEPRRRSVGPAIGILLDLVSDAAAEEIRPESFGWL